MSFKSILFLNILNLQLRSASFNTFKRASPCSIAFKTCCYVPGRPNLWPYNYRAFDLRDLIQFDVVNLPEGVTMLV
ncbi:hypothetical protein B0H16DRAFT_1622819 [Mycena metata]|uniref:Uncharacterized protein n=1 Tax=Mycena metata TaxID=1033252 RepID=A0AAD7H6C9_9AGAR|nr:hypothetical protein B0H16DRAFT_1622819 [Mycena metata]